ncbi:MAG: type I-B CRISPR-associated protein Cas8b1/Cst1 [Candidatus Omnitrophica bacterium]|nr:type I-B CRISPR-associated protein Cas8b1/Cst1 [Candidatus Omnitrophota bacterium]MDD5441111.1 type I-B CRISPR-associated protein Cas8b1/Cst1 [Candidatus Omnitrophota bacterium]
MAKDCKKLKTEVKSGVFTLWQEVDITVIAFTDMGVKVAVNDEYLGLAYKNEIFTDLAKDQSLKGYIKCIRADGKIDISFQPLEGKHVANVTEDILALLASSGGKLPFNDKTSPERIKQKFGISKKVFKKAIGVLYKQRKIKITDSGIERV